MRTPLQRQLRACQVRSVVQPATPIQHLVVIFQENVSFDHYFGTYPYRFEHPSR